MFNNLNSGIPNCFFINNPEPAVTDGDKFPAHLVCTIDDYLCIVVDPDTNAFYRDRHATSSSERCMIPLSIKSNT